MKIEKLINDLQALQQIAPGAEVKMHHWDGNNLLFALTSTNLPQGKNVVWLEDATDNDMSAELDARFTDALENQMDELDFFMDLVETGITLEDIQKYLPAKYNYAKSFMTDHGLI